MIYNDKQHIAIIYKIYTENMLSISTELEYIILHECLQV